MTRIIRQTDVLEVVRSMGRPVTAREIAEAMGADAYGSVRNKLGRSLRQIERYGLVSKTVIKQYGMDAEIYWEAVE